MGRFWGRERKDHPKINPGNSTIPEMTAKVPQNRPAKFGKMPARTSGFFPKLGGTDSGHFQSHRRFNFRSPGYLVHQLPDAVLRTYPGIIFLNAVWKKVPRKRLKKVRCQKKCLRAPARGLPGLPSRGSLTGCAGGSHMALRGMRCLEPRIRACLVSCHTM